MTDTEAKEAIKKKTLIGISNVPARSGFCLFSTGYLVGKKGKNFLFLDRWGEVEVVRSASAFNLVPN